MGSPGDQFADLACVPASGNRVLTAKSLYSLNIRDKVALLSDGDQFLPLEIVKRSTFTDPTDPSKKDNFFMDLLPFRTRLIAQHCFEALCNIPTDMEPAKEQELRKILVKWIKSSTTADASILAGYRSNKNALWYNGASEKKHIGKLYALHPKSNLEQYFGNHPFVIDSRYVANKDDQSDAFRALGLTVITGNDVETVPSDDKKPATDSYSIKNKIKFYALIIAGIESAESWKSEYEFYCKQVDTMTFWTCSAIEKRYIHEARISKRLSGFHYEKGKNDFYYKDDLESKLVFLDYVKAVMDHLGIKADIEIVKRVMDSMKAACELVESEYGRLLHDDDFVAEVRKTMPSFNQKKAEEPVLPSRAVQVSSQPAKVQIPNPPVIQKEIPPVSPIFQTQSEETASLGKADDDPLSERQKIEAQLEAQRYLREHKPFWRFPEHFAEVDEDDKPYCFSVFKIIDECGITKRVVLKSYKYDKAPFCINPEEWDHIIEANSMLLIYTGKDIKIVDRDDIIRDQQNIVLRFSTANLDIEERISELSYILHYFKQIKFDFNSFNIPARAVSIIQITNKNDGTQSGGSENEI